MEKQAEDVREDFEFSRYAQQIITYYKNVRLSILPPGLQKSNLLILLEKYNLYRSISAHYDAIIRNFLIERKFDGSVRFRNLEEVSSSIEKMTPLICQYLAYDDSYQHLIVILNIYYEIFNFDPRNVDYFEGGLSTHNWMFSTLTHYEDYVEDVKSIIETFKDDLFSVFNSDFVRKIIDVLPSLHSNQRKEVMEIIEFLVLGYRDAALWKSRKLLEITLKIDPEVDKLDLELFKMLDVFNKKYKIKKSTCTLLNFIREAGNEGTHPNDLSESTYFEEQILLSIIAITDLNKYLLSKPL